MSHLDVALRGLRRGRLLVALCAGLAWAAWHGFEALLMANMVTSQDHEAAAAMLERARDPLLFTRAEPPGEGAPGRPMIYFEPRKRRVDLFVYGLVDGADQDRVLARLAGPRERPVRVRFYEREVWLPAPQGGRSAGQATLLREVRLAD